MFNKFPALLFIFIFSLCVFAQQSKSNSNEQIVEVNFCDLLKNPDAYKDKTVRVKATYRYGFEWSELYCSDCQSQGNVWVDFDDAFQENSKKKYRNKLKENGDGGRTVNVVFTGKFLVGGHYGHMSGYSYGFTVERVESAEVIYKLSPISNALPAEIKAKTYCQKKH